MCALLVPMVQYTAPSSGSDRNGCSSGGVHCRALRGASSGRVPRASNNGGGIARRKAETLRFHFRFTAAASSRDIAASLSFDCCCEQQRRSGVTSFNCCCGSSEVLSKWQGTQRARVAQVRSAFRPYMPSLWV